MLQALERFCIVRLFLVFLAANLPAGQHLTLRLSSSPLFVLSPPRQRLTMLLLELLLLVTAQLATCQQQAPENIPSPTFFISLTSVCRFNDVEMNPDTTFVAKGSLCAYAEQAGVMYSCPAGDP